MQSVLSGQPALMAPPYPFTTDAVTLPQHTLSCASCLHMPLFLLRWPCCFCCCCCSAPADVVCRAPTLQSRHCRSCNKNLHSPLSPTNRSTCPPTILDASQQSHLAAVSPCISLTLQPLAAVSPCSSLTLQQSHLASASPCSPLQQSHLAAASPCSPLQQSHLAAVSPCSSLTLQPPAAVSPYNTLHHLASASPCSGTRHHRSLTQCHLQLH
jgi:hypothetical protein